MQRDERRTRLRAAQLLPGGFPYTYFSARDPDDELYQEVVSLQQARLLEERAGSAALKRYIRRFEQLALRHGPSSAQDSALFIRAFEQLLLALSVLSEPPAPPAPLFCVVAGPSGAGKD